MYPARLASPIAFGLDSAQRGVAGGFCRRDSTRPSRTRCCCTSWPTWPRTIPFWCLLADAATAVLWWHPAVWWLRRQLQLASEMAADEASLLVADGPRVLAECLVELGARLLEPPAAGHLPVTGFRSHLGRRVQRLMRLEGRAWSPPRRLPAALARSFRTGGDGRRRGAMHRLGCAPGNSRKETV